MAVLTDGEIKEFREIFSKFDVDGNGEITVSELKIALNDLGLGATEEEVHAMISEVDNNASQSLEFEEFCQLLKKWKKLLATESELKEAFKSIDVNGDGCLTKVELVAGLSKLGIQMTETQVDELIKQADMNGDGEVNYEEFVRIWRRLRH